MGMATKKEEKIILDALIIEVKRSNRKSLAIEVTRDATVLVRAPFFLPMFRIRGFVAQREEWILEHVLQAKQRKMERVLSGENEISAERIRFLTAQARMHLPVRTACFAKQMGVQYERISIRHQKTRWGSCSGRGNLNFNCMLMAMPESIQDYVIVHELCHLKEMNHSPAFWAQVEKVLPDYKERRAWLKENGSKAK